MSTRRYEQQGLPGRMIERRNTPEKSTSGSGVDAAAQLSSQADHRLHEQIIQVLRTTGYINLRDLRVIVSEGHVLLQGRVPSFYLKQVAQSAVRELPGVIELRNELVVLGYGRPR